MLLKNESTAGHTRASAASAPAKTRFSGALVCALGLLLVFSATSPAALAQVGSDMVVGTPVTDANGVKYYPVSSVYQGSQQQIIRVLEPTNPAPGKPRRILFVLPVDAGVDTTSSQWSDGLEELRLLDVQDRFNMVLIAPSFNYEPWFGDNNIDASFRMESFIIDNLVPFGDTFAQGTVPQRYLIGFSKSGNGVLFLMLRHPGVFNAGAAWDSPAQQSSLAAFSALPMNFGTQANYNTYNIPALVAANPLPFRQQNRLWISGDQAAWTADMDELNDQMNAVAIAHTWVAGPTRAHSWNSGWLDGAVTDLDANATLTAPDPSTTTAPPRTGGLPAGILNAGTTQATLTLRTDDAATCRYSTTAGVAYGSMPNTFSSTGANVQSTTISGLQNGGSYTYYVRCQDTATGLANTDDYIISFLVSASSSGSTVTSTFQGAENPLYESGMWGTTGSWTPLAKNNGAYATGTSSAARLLSPTISADQFSQVTYDQDPGNASWAGVMTRIQSASNGSGYLAIAYNGQIQLYRTADTGTLTFTLLASANATLGTSPRQLRLESQGSTHRVYFNGAQLITYTDPNNVYSFGQPGIAASVFGGPTVRLVAWSGGPLTTGGGTTDTTPPLRSAGLPTGTLASGTTQATLSLTTDEAATCRYATTTGVAYTAMTNTFATTGGTSHSTTITGLQGGATYAYYVRCQDTAGNANPDDYPIAFSVAATSGGGGTTTSATSSFTGVENPLSESGMWTAAGSWTRLAKNNGAYATGISSAARLATPTVSADQFTEITYDQDPGSSAWAGVMTRVQSATNGSGYLAIAYNGQVQLYRATDSGALGFTLLAAANATLGTAPRHLRLESQGSTHRVYFNGTQLITYTDSSNVFTAGQPGIAASLFGGVTIHILTFSGGALSTGGTDTTPPVRSAGLPTGALASGTTQTTLSLTTNEAATCRYSTTAGVAYSAMTSTFSTTGGTSQSTPVTGLQSGKSYTYEVRCQDTAGNANPDDYPISFSVAASSGDTTPPVRSAGLPTGALASGTTQTSLSLTTNEAATCRYSTTASVAYSAMTSTFSTTGGTSQSTTVTGLQSGASYTYYVRCKDTSGNANPDDYPISFSVAASSGGGTTTATSSFTGVENPLSESGMWSAAGSWTRLAKNNGAYATGVSSAARLLTPTVSADQFSEITYDQDPGNSAWAGVMTRIQSASNGSGYLAIAYNGQVQLYRATDSGSLGFTLVASANATLGTAPRRLRLESQGSTHRVYFNGTLLITFTDSANVYTTGQPGIAASAFGGPTVHVLTFSGGALGN
ncbi:MAG TPA: hypothetical protein VHX37_00565 [Acidobacteriaceae bacterium]|nr:hypothetical protein [Acidobacteriaceae bacterium]